MSEEKSIFEELNAVNCNEFTEKKNGITFLSWANAWEIVKKLHPDANYEIVHFDGKPYHYDANLGYMVETTVTISGMKMMMWLPVMDSSNHAQKSEPYTFKVKEYKNGKPTGNWIERTVEAATMFDVNTAIMRCLTKNLAMFGLGLYIYRGEDLPQEEKVEKQLRDEAELQEVIGKINSCMSIDEMKVVYESCPQFASNKKLISAINQRAKKIEAGE